jgi:transmembrane sensor
MSKVHLMPDQDRIEREASEWIARLNADDVSQDDHTRFKAWCEAHPSHARAYHRLSTTWRAFAVTGPVVRAVSFGRSMDEVAKVRKSRWRWPGPAAAVLAVVASGIAWYAHRTPGTTFETAIGGHASESLPDGSTLELNSNSLARVSYSEHARVIRLERGEAYFRVIHDAGRPFWVVADSTWVRDVGTAFDVERRKDGVRVTVSEGTVEVAPAKGFASRTPSDEGLTQAAISVVNAGQEVDMRGSAGSIRTLRTADITRTAAWRSGSVYFENQPLSQVVDELARYTTLRLVVEDPKLRELPVGGTFRANPEGVDAFLTMIHDGFGLTIRREDSRVYIE